MGRIISRHMQKGSRAHCDSACELNALSLVSLPINNSDYLYTLSYHTPAHETATPPASLDQGQGVPQR